jgi:hypothetical protein
MLALSVLLIVSAGLAIVGGTGVTAGVQAGNYFEYKVQSATSNTELSGADNFTVTILNVTGLTVNYELTMYYPDGTTSNDTGYTDLTNGNSQGSWIITAANLQAGDPVYPSWSWTINETVTMNGRQTNHLSVNNAYLNNTGQNGFITGDFYADKATGVAVALTINITGQQNMSYSYTLISSDIIIPEFSTIAFAATMVALTACTATVTRALGRSKIGSKRS